MKTLIGHLPNTHKIKNKNQQQQVTHSKTQLYTFKNLINDIINLIEKKTRKKERIFLKQKKCRSNVCATIAGARASNKYVNLINWSWSSSSSVRIAQHINCLFK